MNRITGTVVGLFILGAAMLLLPSWSFAGPPVFGEGIGTNVTCKPGTTIGSKLGSTQPIRAHGVCVENLSITDTRVNITVIGDGYPGDGTIAPVGAVGGCGNDIRGLYSNLAGSLGTVIFGADPLNGAVVNIRGRNILITDVEIVGRRADDPAISSAIGFPDWIGACVAGVHATEDSNCNNTRGIQINRGGTLAVGRNVALGGFAGTTDGRFFIEGTGVCVHDVGKRGIEASGQAFVRITNSEVHHTGGDAVSISEGSAADIGFDSGGHYTNFFTTAFPGPGHSGPNFIHDTLGSGINLQHGSEARIYGNNISTNAKSGIALVNHSQGDVGYNLLNGNTLFGISATDNSNINLGTSTKLAPNDCPADPLPQKGSCNGTSVDAGTQANKVNSSLFANSVTVGNLKGGIQCGAGAAGKNFAVIAGKSSLGSDGLATTSLNSNGAVGANDFSAPCAATGTLALN